MTKQYAGQWTSHHLKEWTEGSWQWRLVVYNDMVWLRWFAIPGKRAGQIQ